MENHINLEKVQNDFILPKLKTKKEFKKEDFELISISGKGSYGTVLKVKLKNEINKIYGIKVMEINTMQKLKKLHHIYLENEILFELNHPNIVKLEGSFKTKNKIYLVLEYLSKGDFSDFIKINYPLKDKTIRFYIAEIVNILEYLQKNNIIHRDLKPENIMLDDNYHLKLIDFATIKKIGKIFDKEKMIFIQEDQCLNNKNENNFDEDDEEINKKRSMSFVGTAEYVSPEILKDNPPSFGTDIWALGCIIYKMYYGKTPYYDKTQYLIFRNIEKNEIFFDDKISVPNDAKDLIKKLLITDNNLRLGAGSFGSEFDINNLKKHPFFNDINFENLINESPPFINEFNLSYLNKNTNLNNINKVEKNVNIEVIKEGILEKKSPWFHYNKRKVILYSTPKINYIDPKTNELKGTIELNKECKAEHIDMSYFILLTPNRKYKFKVSDNSAYVWEKLINETILKNSSK